MNVRYVRLDSDGKHWKTQEVAPGVTRCPKDADNWNARLDMGLFLHRHHADYERAQKQSMGRLRLAVGKPGRQITEAEVRARLNLCR